MRPFIVLEADSRLACRELHSYPDQAERFVDACAKTGDLEAVIDIGDFPQIIGHWRDVFSRELPGDPNFQSKARFIKEARDKVAHPDTKDLAVEETRAYFFHIAEVLGLIKALDEQNEVKRIRGQLIADPTPPAALVETPADSGASQSPASTPEPTTASSPRPAGFPPLGHSAASPARPAGPLPPEHATPPIATPHEHSQPQPDARASTEPKDLETTSDRAALAALYHATNGQRWANNSNWLSDKPLGEWHGIATDDSGNTTELDLSDNELSGEIPADLCRLTKLEVLSLLGNPLTGHIPPSLLDIPVNDLLELGLPIGEPEASAPVESTQAADRRPQLDLRSLNEQQRMAVTHADGPLLIFAGPGTGKTRVITYRVAHLIESSVPPWSILAVTFTNKAASEMRERIKTLVGAEAGKVNVGTFHSQALSILRRNIQYLDREPDFTVYDSADQLRLIKYIVRQERINVSGINESAIRNEISRAKDDLLDDNAYARRAIGYDSRIENQTVARVYHRYQQLLEDANGVDFGDMLLLCLRIFREFPEVLAFCQDRFRYILVDEYQDINHAQYEFIRELGSSRGNICVVGDDDQNIYSWRGASVRYIREFAAQFPGSSTVKLERNYRSTSHILAGANAVISVLPDRVHKSLWTEREDGEPLAIIESHDENDEARQVAKLVRELHDKGVKYSDIAVTYRFNAQSRPFEAVFRQHGLPHRLVNDRGFYDRTEVRMVLAYLRATANPRDTISFEDIADAPQRRINAKDLQAVNQRARQIGCAPGELARQLAAGREGESALIDLGQLLLRLDRLADELPVSQFIDAILRESGYDNVLNNDPDLAEERWDNMRELKGAATTYDELGPRQSLERFLNETALLSNEDSLGDDEDSVSLLTAHASKGLEFGAVIVVGLEDGTFPSSYSLNDPEQAAGERRLVYVALTRAKDRLFLSHARRRSGRDAPRQFPSRFLRDVPTDLLTYWKRLPALQTATISSNNLDVLPHRRDTRPLVRGRLRLAPMNYGTANTPIESAPTPKATSQASTSDRDALITLYQTTGGPYWSNNCNWLSDTPIGEWYGVTTDEIGRVIMLSLKKNNLQGTIPPELSQLTSLKGLFLGNNHLYGTIPPEIDRLSELTYVSFSHNQLTGAIPSGLEHLTSLKMLKLSPNQFSGTIPSELQRIPHNDLSKLGLPFTDG